MPSKRDLEARIEALEDSVNGSSEESFMERCERLVAEEAGVFRRLAEDDEIPARSEPLPPEES